MIILRDNTKIKDFRLNRIEEFDDESKNYRIKYTLSKNNESVLWKCKKHLNQGIEGSCVGHGITHSLISNPISRKNFTHESAVNIYYDAQKQ